MDEEIGQPPHLGPVALGHADHLRDDVHSQDPREVTDEVEAALVEGGPEMPAGEIADPRLQVEHTVSEMITGQVDELHVL